MHFIQALILYLPFFLISPWDVVADDFPLDPTDMGGGSYCQYETIKLANILTFGHAVRVRHRRSHLPGDCFRSRLAESIIEGCASMEPSRAKASILRSAGPIYKEDTKSSDGWCTTEFFIPLVSDPSCIERTLECLFPRAREAFACVSFSSLSVYLV